METVFPKNSVVDSSLPTFHPLLKKGQAGALPDTVLDKSNFKLRVNSAYTKDITPSAGQVGQGLMLNE